MLLPGPPRVAPGEPLHAPVKGDSLSHLSQFAELRKGLSG